MKRVIAIVLVVVLLLGTLGTAAFMLLRPKDILGSEDVYTKVTLQLEDNSFYDVRVPVEAKLESTDGATIYSFDLLTVGVQDNEPSAYCKVKVGDRWVFAASEDNWLKATLKGFEEEEPYSVTYGLEDMVWEDVVPPVAMSLDSKTLSALKEGSAYVFGGDEFISTQVAYGTFDTIMDRAFLKMVGLYKQTPRYGKNTGEQLWVTCNGYTVAVQSLNYNTCLLITARGEIGKQYAAALMEDAE